MVVFVVGEVIEGGCDIWLLAGRSVGLLGGVGGREGVRVLREECDGEEEGCGGGC